MSQAERQARWRQNTELRRIELNLLPDAVEVLDALVQQHGAASRAEVVEHFITGAILSPLLVDLRQRLLDACETLRQVATRRQVWGADGRLIGAAEVHSLLDQVMQQLEQLGT